MATSGTSVLQASSFKEVLDVLNHGVVQKYFDDLRYYDGDSVTELILSSIVTIGLAESSFAKTDRDRYVTILINKLPENTLKKIQTVVVEQYEGLNKDNKDISEVWNILYDCLKQIDKDECAVEDTSIGETDTQHSEQIGETQKPELKHSEPCSSRSVATEEVTQMELGENEDQDDSLNNQETTAEESHISTPLVTNSGDYVKTLTEEAPLDTDSDDDDERLIEINVKTLTEEAPLDTDSDDNDERLIEIRKISKSSGFELEYVNAFRGVRNVLQNYLSIPKHRFEQVEKNDEAKKIVSEFKSSQYTYTINNSQENYVALWVGKLVDKKFMSINQFIDALMLKIPYKYLLHLEKDYEGDFSAAWILFINELVEIEKPKYKNLKLDKKLYNNANVANPARCAVLNPEYILKYRRLLVKKNKTRHSSHTDTDILTIPITIGVFRNISYKCLLYFAFTDKLTKFPRYKEQPARDFIDGWKKLWRETKFMYQWDFFEELLEKFDQINPDDNVLKNYHELKKLKILEIDEKKALKEILSQDIKKGLKLLKLECDMTEEMFYTEFIKRWCLDCYNIKQQ